jgi:hypothetical protein
MTRGDAGDKIGVASIMLHCSCVIEVRAGRDLNSEVLPGVAESVRKLYFELKGKKHGWPSDAGIDRTSTTGALT